MRSAVSVVQCTLSGSVMKCEGESLGMTLMLWRYACMPMKLLSALEVLLMSGMCMRTFNTSFKVM